MGIDPVLHPPKQVDPYIARHWIRPHYASFNGLRGVAVAMVFLCHYAGSPDSFTSNTLWVGVDLFFVLSGFLITGILFDSLESPRYFRNFYIRRALRIFPVFYGFFVLLFCLTPMLHLHFHWDLLTFSLYFGNLIIPFIDVSRHDPAVIWIVRPSHLLEVANIGHLWSLCVEEQFYLLWPAVVFWVRDRRRLMYLCVIASAITLGGRVYLVSHASVGALSYYVLHCTYTRCDSLLIGSWFALFLRGRALSRVHLRQLSAMLFWISLVVFVLGLAHWRGPGPIWGILYSPFTRTVGFTLIALAAAGVLLSALDDDHLISRALRNRLLSGLGVISYGFYFWHYIPFPLWQHLAELHPRLRDIIPPLASTTAVAWLSFKLLETPFLRLKKVLAPQISKEDTAATIDAYHLHVSEPRP
jgi:peptidoglycan/LPS O-acetylase OafA/YrhL